tara:strand:+ start:382 stop:1419 length:1038 start_codon:yes stop_codon:yes gene_type:complete
MGLLYGIAGFKGHGKDTFAHLVCNANPDVSWYVDHFAGSLKIMAMEIFGLTKDQVYTQEGKVESLDPVSMDDYCDSMSKVTGIQIYPQNKIARSPREILQFFGTEYVRSSRDSFWFDQIKSSIEGKDNVLVPDLRFLNEESFIRSLGGRVIRIMRLGLDEDSSKDLHPSEQESLKILPDLYLGTLTDRFSLQDKVSRLVSHGLFNEARSYDYHRWCKVKSMYENGSVTAEQCDQALGRKGAFHDLSYYYGIRFNSAADTVRIPSDFPGKPSLPGKYEPSDSYSRLSSRFPFASPSSILRQAEEQDYLCPKTGTPLNLDQGSDACIEIVEEGNKFFLCHSVSSFYN